MNITERMKTAADKASLTVSDMALWFGVTRAAMNTWLNEDRSPHANKEEQLDMLLFQLESIVDSKLGIFPIPLSVKQYERKPYIEKVKHAAGELLSAGAPSRGTKVLGLNKR